MGREIFISYSRKNLDEVRAIKDEIERETGVECWMDLNAIESGASQFTQDIVNGIKGCRVFLFMLSRESQVSKFALRELDFAMKKSEKDNQKHVVIVNVDDCEMLDEFEFMYGLTDMIAWKNQPQKAKLIRDLKRWIGVEEKTESKTEVEKTDQKSSIAVNDNKITLDIIDKFSFVLEKDRANNVFIGNIPVREILDYVNIKDNPKDLITTYLLDTLKETGPLAILFPQAALAWTTLKGLLKFGKLSDVESKAFSAILSELNNRYHILLEKLPDEIRSRTSIPLTDFAVSLDLSQPANSPSTLLERLKSIKSSPI